MMNLVLTFLWLFCRIGPGIVLLLSGMLGDKSFDNGMMAGAGAMLLAAGVSELYKDFKK